MSESCRWLCYRIWQKSSDYLSPTRDRKILLLLLYYYHMEYIWMIIGDREGLYIGFGLGQALSEASVAFVPSESIEDRPLLRMVVRSQTYYPEHILAYGSGKTCYSLIMGSGSFWTGFQGWVLGEDLSTILRPGLRCWGLEAQVWTGTQTP